MLKYILKDVELVMLYHTPARLNFNQWKDKIVVLKDKQMPVIKEQEKKEVFILY